MPSVRDLMKNFSGQGGETPTKAEVRRESEIQARKSVEKPPMQRQPSSGTVVLGYHEQILQKQRLEKEQARKKTQDTVRAKPKGYGGLSLLEKGADIAKQNKQVQESKSETTMRPSSGVVLSYHEEHLRKQRVEKQLDVQKQRDHKKITTKGCGSLSLLDAGVTLAAQQKAQEEEARRHVESLKTKSVSSLGLLDSGAALAAQRKAQEEEARRHVESLKAKSVAGSYAEDHVRKIEKNKKALEDKAKQDIDTLKATYKGSSGGTFADQELRKIEKNKKAMDDKAKQELDTLKATYKGSAGGTFTDQELRKIEKNKKAMEDKAKQELDTLKATYKGSGTVSLIEEAAYSAQKKNKIERQHKEDAKRKQSEFRGVCLTSNGQDKENVQEQEIVQGKDNVQEEAGDAQEKENVQQKENVLENEDVQEEEEEEVQQDGKNVVATPTKDLQATTEKPSLIEQPAPLATSPQTA